MRLVAAAGNFCLTIRSLIAFLTICWLVEERSSLTDFIKRSKYYFKEKFDRENLWNMED